MSLNELMGQLYTIREAQDGEGAYSANNKKKLARINARSVVVGVRENAFQNTNTASSSFFFSIEVLKKYTNQDHHYLRVPQT